MVAATVEWKVRAGASPGTEYPTTGNAANCNWMSTDAYDSTGTGYQTNSISVPATGTNYAYERYLCIKATSMGDSNLIDNIKIWHDTGTLSDAALDLPAGVGATYATPVNTNSSIATTILTGWDTEAEALDITPTGGLTTAGDISKYLVTQLDVPSTVTTPGDIGSQTVKVKYDES